MQLRNLLIMKFFFLFVFVFTLGTQASTVAQTVNLTKKKAPLIEIFREIKKQTGYTIICDANILKNAKPVTVYLRNSSLKTALKESLQSNDLNYLIEGESIVIRKSVTKNNPKNLDSNMGPSSIQQSVTGTVFDAKGPLAGVTVSVKGSATQITSTNAEGKYTLQIPASNATLVFSIIGYIRTEVDINYRAVVNITLQPEETEMTEVVVVGYGTQKKLLLRVL